MRTSHQPADEQCKQLAAIAAQYKSSYNRANYSNAEIAQAQSALSALELCYDSDGMYISYRKKFIAIKVSSPYQIKNHSQLFLLESEWIERGYQRVETAQGVIYRLPKKG